MPFSQRIGFIDNLAANQKIADAGSYWTGTDTEAALQETGSQLAQITPQVVSNLVKYKTDFIGSSASQFYWSGAAINTGTMASTSTTAKHPGKLYFKSHASNADSGYYFYSMGDSLVLGGGYRFTEIFSTAATLTGVTRRMGFLDTTSVTAPTDGAYVKILNGVLTGQTVSATTGSTTSTNRELLADTWYRIVIELNTNGTLVTFILYADDSTTALWTDTLATNIPTGALGSGDVCTLATPGAATLIGYVDYMEVSFPNARITDNYGASTPISSVIGLLTDRWNGISAGFLGDSITSGSNPGGTPTQLPVDSIYYGVVADQLNLGSIVADSWVGSAISREASYSDKRYTKRYLSLPTGLDLVCVMGLVNDFAQDATLGAISDAATDADNVSFFGSVKFLINGLVDRYPSADIVFITSTPRNSNSETYYSATNGVGKTMIDYVNALKQVCSMYSVPVLDLYANSGLYPWNATHMAAYMPDGLHPNAAGHAKIASKLSGFLATL